MQHSIGKSLSFASLPRWLRGRSLPSGSLSLIHGVLSAPNITPSIDAPVGGGSDWAGYDYVASGLRSNLPLILQHGLATEEEVDIDTFAERLRAEVVGQQGVIMLPTFIGAWARLP